MRLDFVLARSIPSVVDQLRLTGFDANGQVVYGPAVRPKSSSIVLSDIPITTTLLQIEYLAGGNVIGLARLPVALQAGQTLVVNDPPYADVSDQIQELRVQPQGAQLPVGLTVQYQATAVFVDGTQLNFTTLVNWRVTNASASINAQGLATAQQVGACTVEARFADALGTAQLTVTGAVVTGLQVSPLNPSVPTGLNRQFTAAATFSDGNNLNVTAQVTWSSTTGAAAINQSGLATGLQVGQTTIIAGFQGFQANTTLNVTAAVLQSLEVTPAVSSIPVGLTQQLTATGFFSDGSAMDLTEDVNWGSSAAGTAAVSDTAGTRGLVTGIAAGGPVTITANGAGGVSDTAGVTVTAAVVTDVQVTPVNPSVPDGLTQQFTATALFSDGTNQDVTVSANWDSSTGAATVDQNGLATGVQPGQTTITATFQGNPGQTTLTVTAAVLQSLDVTPAAPSIPAGFTEQLVATGFFSDGSSRNITEEVQWSSADPAIASVSNTAGSRGLVSGVSAGGPVSVTATAPGNISDNAQVTATAAVEPIELVSVDSSGAQGNADSGRPGISADGRYVVFLSEADNLVPGDTNAFFYDTFVHDRQTGMTTLASVSSDGTQANEESWNPTISGDGRYVAFKSHADNLVAGISSTVFVHDRQTGETTGRENGGREPSLSWDGRYVAFWSGHSNLVPGDTNGRADVFVLDRQTGQTQSMSVDSSGNQGNDRSEQPSISADGRYVAFWSDADNLVPGDTNGVRDVFVHDRQTGQTERVSVDSAGGQASGSNCDQPAISADGRFVAFRSGAANLVAGDTNADVDVFVHDRQTGQTERANVDSSGAQSNGRGEYPTISGDGRYVAFWSDGDNLIPGDTNGRPDIFVHDRQTGRTQRVSVDATGAEANGESYEPAISADGRFVTFWSSANNLVSGDLNGQTDVFVVRMRWPE